MSQNFPSSKNNKPAVPKLEVWRSSFLLAFIMLSMVILALWAIRLQLIENDFLQGKGEAR